MQNMRKKKGIKYEKYKVLKNQALIFSICKCSIIVSRFIVNNNCDDPLEDDCDKDNSSSSSGYVILNFFFFLYQ